MACAITSLFLMAMFGIIAAGVAFGPSAPEKPSGLSGGKTPVASCTGFAPVQSQLQEHSGAT